MVGDFVRDGFPGAEVDVAGDDSDLGAMVVSDALAGLIPINRLRLVTDTVKPQAASGALHALSTEQLVPDQRDGQNKATEFCPCSYARRRRPCARTDESALA
jgi:acid stress-induced BolA-like protein IbaG/YrbA